MESKIEVGSGNDIKNYIQVRKEMGLSTDHLSEDDFIPEGWFAEILKGIRFRNQKRPAIYTQEEIQEMERCQH